MQKCSGVFLSDTPCMLTDTVYLNAQQANLSLTFGDYIALADLGLCGSG